MQDEIMLFTYLIEHCANDIYVGTELEYQKWSRRTRAYKSLSSIYGSIMPFPNSLYFACINSYLELITTVKPILSRTLFRLQFLPLMIK